MTTPTDNRPATRREVYAAVAPVWIFLLVLIISSMRSGFHWSDLVLFAAAAASTVMYLRAAYRPAA